jgi:hypothetical protein
MAYWLVGLDSIPGRIKKFFCIARSQDRLCGPGSYTMGFGGVLSQAIKRPGRKTNHSLSSSIEVKNGGTIPPLPICLQGEAFN